MKKVLIVVWNNFTNDKRVMNISNSLVNNEYNVSVIAAKEQKGLSRFEQKGYRIYRIPLFSSLYSVQNKSKIIISKQTASKSSLKYYIKNSRFRKMITAFLNWISFNIGVFLKGFSLKPDVIYANDLDTLTVSYILSKILKTKLIFDSHELWLHGAKYLGSTRIHQLLWKAIHSLLIKRADSIIVTTESRAIHLQDNLNIKKVNVVRNCPHYEPIKYHNLFRDEYNIQPETPILIYQGSIIRKRGIFTIVDAVSYINEVAVVFMGMGNDKNELFEYISKKNLQDRIFIKDAVPSDQVVKYVSSADIGFQIFEYTMNHYTVISNKLLECIMAGIAVIASDFPEIRKIVTENNNGIVVDPENKVQIRKAITKLVTNRDLLESFKLNSKNNRHKYTWEEEEKVLLRIFSEIS